MLGKQLGLNSYRTASCVALEECILITFHHEVFKHYVGKLIMKINSKRLSTLQKISLFKDWEYAQLSGLVRYLSLRDPIQGQYIYKEGDVDRNIYIVLEGEFEITSRIKTQKSNIDGFDNYMKNTTPAKEVTILKLKKGGHFGDEDGYNSKFKKFSVKASSTTCKVFALPKDVLLLFLIYIENKSQLLSKKWKH